MVVVERLEFLANIVLTTKVEKMLSKGCEAYLAYVLNLGDKKLRVYDIQNAKDFPYVFPKELSGLPPNRV